MIHSCQKIKSAGFREAVRCDKNGNFIISPPPPPPPVILLLTIFKFVFLFNDLQVVILMPYTTALNSSATLMLQ